MSVASPLRPWAALVSADLNLVLTGTTGPNQPAIGRRVAAALGRPFVHVEALLEARYGDDVPTLRATYGAARLKVLENEAMDEVLLRRGVVLRVSGSVLAHSDNLAKLAATGPVICLVAALDAVLHRAHVTMGARYHDPAERAVTLGELRREWWVRGRPGVYELDATTLDEPALVAAAAALWRDLALVRA